MIIKETFAEYRESPAVNIHFLYDFDRSPAHALEEKKRTPAMETGELFHAYCLEPEKFDNLAVFETELKPNRKGKVYKAWKKLQKKGSLILKQDDFLSFCKMKMNIEIHLEGCGLLDAWEKGVNEVSLYFIRNGIDCKCRIDKFFQFGNEVIIFDLKTTEDCEKFKNHDIAAYQCYRQAEWYSFAIREEFGLNSAKFYFIPVEKKAPYGVKCISLDPDYMMIGEKENNASLERYSVWDRQPTIYEPVIETVQCPAWKMRSLT